jgi:hypothetical protein
MVGGSWRALARIERTHELPQIPRPRRLHPILVGDGQGIIGREHVDPRERAPRTADHVEGAAARLLFQRRFLERGLEELARLALSGRARIEPEHSEWQGNAVACLATCHVDQFETAATEVSDDAVRVRNAGDHPFAGKHRLLLRAQQLASETDPFDLTDKVQPVLGVADSRGGHHLRSLHVHMIEQQLETAERGKGPRARLPGKLL